MPHLLIERTRSVPFVCLCRASKRGDAAFAYLVEVVDIIGGISFIVGSVCFLPVFAEDISVFLAGCCLFIVGALVYFGICMFTLAEATRERGLLSFEVCENLLYLVGSVMFVFGTVLYYPPEAHHLQMNWIVQRLSLGVYFNLFSPEYEGTLLFILGSAFFAFAAFVNGLNQRSFDTLSSQMLTVTTTLYMAGSLLFVMGSVAFLPDHRWMLTIGAWCYIIGSSLYVLGSVLSLWRTHRELRNPSHMPLKVDRCQ